MNISPLLFRLRSPFRGGGLLNKITLCRSTKPRCICSKASLLQQLRAKIKFSGPITVAEYMKEVLTNPVGGYYMNRDVFGSHGDFITSPEISQMFGELIGVWCVNEWMQSGSPPNIQLVELGPGRGTLADDVLRVFTQFPIKEAVSVHLVEISPTLSEVQKTKLQGNDSSCTEEAKDTYVYKKCRSQHGFDVSWYSHLSDVPKAPSVFIAHEFLDALPIHKFQKTEKGWCEVLVDIDPNSDGLRHVLSRGETLAIKTLLNVKRNDHRDHIEICPEAGLVVEQLASRIADDGGFALLADYGHSGEKGDTFRSFREHQLHDPLVEPGSADLTADVDFSYLRNIIGSKASSHGPITQDQFLYCMGIGARLQVLLGKASPSRRKDLISGYDMLTNHSKMGERFKFFSITPQDGKDYVPAGFAEPS